MSEDKEFDGIRSADNKMPGWYIISFVGTIVFAVVYLLYYHVFTDWSQAKQYAEMVSEANQIYKTTEVAATGGNPYRGDEKAIAAGKQTFAGTCAACHGADAKGNIGPNLTDDTWLHADTEDGLFKVVHDGRLQPDQWKQDPPKGPMPSHAHLGNKTIWEVLAYIESINPSIKPSN